MPKYLIINADDFGASVGINNGIVESHSRGVVTSTSLMVAGRAVHEAVAMSRDCPALSVGLHWDISGAGPQQVKTSDLATVQEAFYRQVDEFHRLLGRLPTHIDSHHHLHRRAECVALFRELVATLGVPLRGESGVRFTGGFYAQWQWMVTNLDYVSVPMLERMLREEVPQGWTEFSCHPGYVSPDFSTVYHEEREAEIRTLTNPTIRQTIAMLDIHLVGYSEYLAHQRS